MYVYNSKQKESFYARFFVNLEGLWVGYKGYKGYRGHRVFKDLKDFKDLRDFNDLNDLSALRSLATSSPLLLSLTSPIFCIIFNFQFSTSNLIRIFAAASDYGVR